MKADRDEAPFYVRKKQHHGLKLALFMGIGSVITLAAIYLFSYRIIVDPDKLREAIQFNSYTFNQAQQSDQRAPESPAINQAENYEFYVTPGETKWSIEASGKATALWNKKLLFIKFDQLKLRSNPSFSGARTIQSVAIGLATRDADGRWKIIDKRSISIHKALETGEYINLTTQSDFDVSSRDLSKYWVVVEVKMATGSTTYAHSREDIFDLKL